MFFRIDVNELKHERFAFDFMDWLGVIGGMTELLIRVATFILGGYLSFN